MDKVKPSTLPGFMELLPEEQILFNKMMDIIRKHYEENGFLPIDTPVLEKTEVLLAKGGGETEKQIYRFTKGDTDMSMRFDLTVPLARYTVEHFSDLNFPFKRYQISKVYRGERAQRGRFREFYQCDIDAIGNGKLSLVNDAQMPVIICGIFKDLKLGNFKVHINNRKILKGFFENLGAKKEEEILRTIDKLDKIGMEKMVEELKDQGLKEEEIEKILEFLQIQGKNSEKISALKSLKIENEKFKEGIEELSQVLEYIEAFGVSEENIEVDLKIARGLDYYTGTVYETFLTGHEDVGSVCSGGRYDNLAEYYTDLKLPGVGISIGLSRLFFKLMEKNLIQAENKSLVDLIVIPMEGFLTEGIKLVKTLKEKGIKAIIYSEEGKIGKKFKYADKLNIPYSLALGENEIKTGLYPLKNMKTSDQEELSIEEICQKLK